MLHQTKDTFEVPEDFSLDGFMRPSFGVFRGEPTRVRIWFSADVAGIEEIKFWVLSWGWHALML